MDLSLFTTAEAWISLVTLLFLEIILGVDNIVFISITSSRLAPEKQHLGRQLGLLGAMVMRIIFLSVASFLVHLVQPLFTINLGFWAHGFSVRDIILLLGGAYLIYKGVSELRSTVRLEDLAEDPVTGIVGAKQISLPKAVGTIMVMDIVFSIDSVITAVGLANHLIIMILAVMLAIALMLVFIDPIADFINKNAEMKILALTFIAAIGVLLVTDSLGIHSDIEILDMHLEKVMVYFAMLFSVIMEFVQLAYKRNLEKRRAAEADEEGADD